VEFRWKQAETAKIGRKLSEAVGDIKRRYFDDFGRVSMGAPQFCRCRGGVSGWSNMSAGVGACQSVRFLVISVVFRCRGLKRRYFDDFGRVFRWERRDSVGVSRRSVGGGHVMRRHWIVHTVRKSFNSSGAVTVTTLTKLCFRHIGLSL